MKISIAIIALLTGLRGIAQSAPSETASAPAAPAVIAAAPAAEGAVEMSVPERGNVQRTGDYRTADFLTAPKSAWQAGAFDIMPIEAEPAISRQTGYFITASGHLRSLSLRSGDENWKHKTGGRVLIPTPIIGFSKHMRPGRAAPLRVGGVVYFGYLDGVLYALDEKTGEPLWGFAATNSIEAAPTWMDGKLLFGDDNGALYCLDPLTRQPLWVYHTPSSAGAQPLNSNWPFTRASITGAPALMNGLIYFGALDGRVYALEQKSGALKWSRPVGSSVAHEVAATAELVYLATYRSDLPGKAGSLIALDALTGEEKWRFPIAGSSRPPAVGDDTIYFGDGKAYFYALDRFTGTVRWRVWLKMSDETSSPSLSRGAVYFTTDHGELRALNRADGKPLWKLDESLALNTAPVLASEMIFVINQNGAHLAFRQ